MSEQTQALPFIDGLYAKLVEGGVRYFFPSAKFDIHAQSPASDGESIVRAAGNSLVLNWLGSRYSLTTAEAFSEAELKLLESIRAVLDTRYRMISDPTLVEQRFELFKGLPEDRYVSAFVDRAPYAKKAWQGPDRIEDAIEVLRTSSLSTYENRRISTGALLFGNHRDACHEPPTTPIGALRYNSTLTSIRSFFRLSDGLQTLALVDKDGFLAEIVDVAEWARPFADIKLSVPTALKYEMHSRATLCGGHICMILTPNGEMKIFADGVQVFHFWNGRWRVTDAQRKYDLWTEAVGNFQLSERLFTAALNLAEDRRGGLLVVLDDAQTAQRLVSRNDLLASIPVEREQSAVGSKDQLHYLLQQKRILDVPSAVLETIARTDGGIVMDGESNLLAFGAILRHPDLTNLHPENIEGGRTTAAISASRFGNVLKVSEDGVISFFRNGKCVWEI